jgi:hypothetical protein
MRPTLRSQTVECAIAYPLTRHTRHAVNRMHTMMGAAGGAPVILALAAHARDQRADYRLLEQIRFSIQAGNEITANGGYCAQHERYITAMYAIARQTPHIWSQLSQDEIQRIDLLMKAGLISSAFTTSDFNPFILNATQEFTIDGDANLSREWNPNFREGMVGGVLAGIAYFSATGAARDILAKYSHSDFVAELRRLNLTNLTETFSWKEVHSESGAPTGEQIESAVRGYRHRGLGLDDPMALYRLLTDNTFGRLVNCGLKGGGGIDAGDGGKAGVLLAGCESLPNRGRIGMLKEFDAFDVPGLRSSSLYSYDGFRCNLVNQIVLIVSGLWREGEIANACVDRIRIGAEDLWFKIDHGYANFAKGDRQPTLTPTTTGHALDVFRPLWFDFVAPLHHIDAVDATSPR